MSATPLAIVALGSNLGNSTETVLQAMKRLQAFSDEPIRVSSLWQSTPVDCPPGSPLFVNAVVALVPRATETPESLLSHLQMLEREYGRGPKKVLNEARVLDLDLIAFGAALRNTASLTLPHPRAHQRRFVLDPLAEIVPDYLLPHQTRTVRQLLAELPTDETVRRIVRPQAGQRSAS